MQKLIDRAKALGFEVKIPSCEKRLPGGRIRQFDFYKPGCDEADPTYSKQLSELVHDKAICEHKRRLGCIVNLRYNRVSINLRGLEFLPNDWTRAAMREEKLSNNLITQDMIAEQMSIVLEAISLARKYADAANVVEPEVIEAVNGATLSKMNIIQSLAEEVIETLAISE